MLYPVHQIQFKSNDTYCANDKFPTPLIAVIHTDVSNIYRTVPTLFTATTADGNPAFNKKKNKNQNNYNNNRNDNHNDTKDEDGDNTDQEMTEKDHAINPVTMHNGDGVVIDHTALWEGYPSDDHNDTSTKE